jgi:hypothetical protein
VRVPFEHPQPTPPDPTTELPTFGTGGYPSLRRMRYARPTIADKSEPRYETSRRAEHARPEGNAMKLIAIATIVIAGLALGACGAKASTTAPPTTSYAQDKQNEIATNNAIVLAFKRFTSVDNLWNASFGVSGLQYADSWTWDFCKDDLLARAKFMAADHTGWTNPQWKIVMRGIEYAVAQTDVCMYAVSP